MKQLIELPFVWKLAILLGFLVACLVISQLWERPKKEEENIDNIEDTTNMIMRLTALGYPVDYIKKISDRYDVSFVFTGKNFIRLMFVSNDQFLSNEILRTFLDYGYNFDPDESKIQSLFNLAMDVQAKGIVSSDDRRHILELIELPTVRERMAAVHHDPYVFLMALCYELNRVSEGV